MQDSNILAGTLICAGFFMPFCHISEKRKDKNLIHEFMKQWGGTIIVAVAVLLLLGTILGMRAVL